MSIQTNIKEVIQGLNDLDRKQIPYATSLALNNTAEIAMKAMKHKIDKDFKVTASWNKVGGKYGIKKKRATKRNLEVEIFIPSSNTWMKDHEDGGTRTNQLIPTNGFKRMFPSLKKNRAIKKKASTLLKDKKKNRMFKAPIQSGSSVMAWFQREKGKVKGARGLKSKKTGRVLKAKKAFKRSAIPMFIIKSSVREKATLDFIDTTMKVFINNIDKEFNKALNYALSTSK